MEFREPVERVGNWVQDLQIVKMVKGLYERLEDSKYGTRFERLLGYLNLYDQCERLYRDNAEYVGTFRYDNDSEWYYRRLVLEVYPGVHYMVIEQDELEGSFTISSLQTTKGRKQGTVNYDSQVIAVMQTNGASHFTHEETFTPHDADLDSQPEQLIKTESKSRILSAAVANEWANFLKLDLRPAVDHFMMIDAVYYGQDN